MKEQHISIYERSQKYNRDEYQKEQIELKKQQQIQKEMNECTFKPRINKSKYLKGDQSHATSKVSLSGLVNMIKI